MKQDHGEKAMLEQASTLYLLHQSGQAVRARLEEALRPLGMTGVKYTIMSIVERGGVSSADIARRLFVTPQTMSETIADLVERNLVLRREDEKSRRILRLSLTPAGRDALSRCHSIAGRVEREAFATLSRNEMRQLRRLLQDVLTHVRIPNQGDSSVTTSSGRLA
jgi:DNA-binding MarR family transcriptional regulator